MATSCSTRAGGLDDREGEDGAGSFTEPQVQVEYRTKAQRVECPAGARFGGHVTGDQGCGHFRRECGGGQRGGSGGNTVQQDRHPGGRAAEQESDGRRVLQPADGGENPDRIRRVGPVQVECPAYDINLPGPGGIVDPGAATGHHLRPGPREARDQRSGRGGVGDTHVAGEQATAAVGDEILRDLDARLDGLDCLGSAHRRAGAEVGRTPADLAHHQVRSRREVGGHAYIHHLDPDTGLPCQRTDHGPPGAERRHHRGGDLLRPR